MNEATPAAPAADTTPPTDPAVLAARDAELTQLYESDRNRYQYEDGGRLAKEHLALRQAQADKIDPTKPAASDDVVGSEDIDLDVLADDAEGDEAGDAEDAEPIDTSAYIFEPAEGEEVTEAGQERITAFAEFAAKNDLAPEAYQGAINWYNDLVKQEQTRLADADKAAQKASVEALGGRETYASTVETAKSVLRTWPKELADAVRSARTSDGRRLALLPEFVRALAGMGDRQATAQPQDRTAMLKAEIAEIDANMVKDASTLYEPWKNSGLSATDFKMKALREIAKPTPKPSAAALRTEEAELLALYERDPMVFEYSAWKGSGKTGAQRLHAIRSGRA